MLDKTEPSIKTEQYDDPEYLDRIKNIKDISIKLVCAVNNDELEIKG
jgi:hypothetical protein